MTTDNETRRRTLAKLDEADEEIPEYERALYTSEWHFAVELSKELGAPGVRHMLARLSSRDFTDYRAAALVNSVLSELAEESAPRRAKDKKRRESIDKMRRR